VDVLEQALNVVEHVEQVEQTAGTPQRVALTLDLNHPVHRAAYAAALAVLGVSGVDLDAVARPGGVDATSTVAGPQFGGTASDATRRPDATSVDASETARQAANPSGTDETGDDELRLRGDYAAALAELVPDEARRNAALNDTFPRVRELLRDGANVEAVAQIQYRRWVEEHPDSTRTR
jgi:hypothetical protein